MCFLKVIVQVIRLLLMDIYVGYFMKVSVKLFNIIRAHVCFFIEYVDKRVL